MTFCNLLANLGGDAVIILRRMNQPLVDLSLHSSAFRQTLIIMQLNVSNRLLLQPTGFKPKQVKHMMTPLTVRPVSYRYELDIILVLISHASLHLWSIAMVG